MLHFHGLVGGMDNLQEDYSKAGDANRRKREAEERARLALKRQQLALHRKAYTDARNGWANAKKIKPEFSVEGASATTKKGCEAKHKAFADEIDWVLANVSAKEIAEDGWPINLRVAGEEKKLLQEHKEIYGWGIAEDKRMINAKSPWTLAHMNMKILQGFYNNPSVPPSMKTKLKNAMAMKPSLKKKLSGGLAGVTKASGFIQRMMAENKKKHGTYKKPTDPAHKDSTMSQWMPFDYKKLANADQGGEGEADYGASPFIQKYFKSGTVPFTKGNTAKETAKQKEARLTMMAKRLTKLAKRLAREQPANQEAQEQVQEAREAVEEVREQPAPVETPAELLEHFGNVEVEAPPIKPKRRIKINLKKVVEVPKEEVPKNEVFPTEEPEEEVEEARGILNEDVLNNTIWSVYVCFWRRFIKRFPKVAFAKGYDWTQPFYSLTYDGHGGFWRNFLHGAPLDIYEGGKKEMYKEFLMKWMGYKEEEIMANFLKAYPEVKFYMPKVSEAEVEKRKKVLKDKKNIMGWSYILWLCGKLVKEHSYTLSIEEADYRIYNKSSEEWITKRGERIILRAPNKVIMSPNSEGKDVWDITTMLTQPYEGREGGIETAFKKPNSPEPYARGEMDKFWEANVYSKAEETDIDIDDNVFAELEPDDGVDRDAMKVMLEYINKETTKRKAEESEVIVKPGQTVKARSGQSGSKREDNIKAILEKTPKATLPVIAEALKALGDTGAGGKPLSAGTLSPIVKKVRASILEGGSTPNDTDSVRPNMSDEDLEQMADDDAHLRRLTVRRNHLRAMLTFSTTRPLSVISSSSSSSASTPPPPPPPPRQSPQRQDRRFRLYGGGHPRMCGV